jgi:uncharacterized damage-inducible protein DinB
MRTDTDTDTDTDTETPDEETERLLDAIREQEEAEEAALLDFLASIEA